MVPLFGTDRAVAQEVVLWVIIHICGFGRLFMLAWVVRQWANSGRFCYFVVLLAALSRSAIFFSGWPFGTVG